MAWSPPARLRRSWLVGQAGDYATIQFHHLRDGTMRATTFVSAAALLCFSSLDGYAQHKVTPVPPPSGPPPTRSGAVPLKSSFTTPAASAFAASFAYPGIGPSYPRQWDWDPALVVGQQPRAATPNMGLKPKIEQYRNGKLIAT